MSAEIFRKVALERLSTPDQLDQALLLTPSASRFALYAAVLAVASMLLASILVSVPIMASGVGIVMQAQGISDVVAANGGRVLKVLVTHGQYIQPGQVLAELAQPDLENALQTVQADIREVANQRNRIQAIHQQDQQLQEQQRLQQREELHLRRNSSRHRLQWLEQRLKQDQTLVESGFLSKNKLKDTEAELLQMRDRLAEVESQLRILASAQASAVHLRERETLDVDLRLASLRHRAQELTQKLARESHLLSSEAGTVAELKITQGDVISSGQEILSLIPLQNLPMAVSANQPLQVIAYFAAGEAKKVHPGMAIRVTPGNVKKEEFGSIVGQVLAVAPIPATAEGMQRTLRNRQLVQSLAQNTAPIEVRLALTADAQSKSGLRWTSQGPPNKLESGTMVQAEVVVKRMRLLVLALPALERWLHVEPEA